MTIVGITASDSAYIAKTPWVWTVPSSRCKCFIWVMSWPLIAIMFITVPDCRQRRWRRWFLVTFLTSIVWISVYSYLMIWMITVIGLSLCLSVCLSVKVKVKAHVALHGNPISELRDVTCHMGSHSVTCHPTQVNVPRLTPAMQAGTRFTYTGGMEG